jgi:hypothetical protein
MDYGSIDQELAIVSRLPLCIDGSRRITIAKGFICRLTKQNNGMRKEFQKIFRWRDGTDQIVGR